MSLESMYKVFFDEVQAQGFQPESWLEKDVFLYEGLDVCFL